MDSRLRNIISQYRCPMNVQNRLTDLWLAPNVLKFRAHQYNMCRAHFTREKMTVL